MMMKLEAAIIVTQRLPQRQLHLLRLQQRQQQQDQQPQQEVLLLPCLLMMKI